jgi:ribosomal protein L35AE/L33A
MDATTNAISTLVGKYVCYRNSESGGFCWGRIKAETKMNTVDGKQDALVLTDVLICYNPNRNEKTGKVTIESPRGDRLIQKRMLNLEKDVIEKSEAFDNVSCEDMFLMLMDGEVDISKYSKSEMVVCDIVKNGGLGFSDVRNEFDKRMNKIQ